MNSAAQPQWASHMVVQLKADCLYSSSPWAALAHLAKRWAAARWRPKDSGRPSQKLLGLKAAFICGSSNQLSAAFHSNNGRFPACPC